MIHQTMDSSKVVGVFLKAGPSYYRLHRGNSDNFSLYTLKNKIK